jgi:hypothetical protein
MLIDAWTKNGWTAEELISCESTLGDSLEADGDLNEDMESRLDTLFGAFDQKAPNARFKN